MPGWVPLDADSWSAIADALPRPWPTEAAAFDLRWWADRRPEVPSRRQLIARWGWTERAVRSLLRDEARWRDPVKTAAPKLPQRRPKVAPELPQPRPNHEQLKLHNEPEMPQPRPKVAPELPQDCPKDVHTRVYHPTHTPSPSQSETRDVTLPAWARKASVPPGTDRHLLMEVVVEARNGVVGTPANPDACGTASKAVLALWKALGHPDLTAFRVDLMLVVEAAKDCPDRVFARDIRAEGWPDGVDRSRDIDTICRHGKWDLRLEAARRWERAGRRTAAAREVWEPEPAAPADDAPTYLRLDPDTQRAIVARAAMSGEAFSNALLERLSIEHIGATP